MESDMTVKATEQFRLGQDHYYGKAVQQDYAEAAKWYRLAADQGLVAAMASLGYLYERGEGVPQDDDEAVKWTRKAADQGDAGAMFCLGEMHKLGNCAPKDFTEAVYWLRKAVESGEWDSAQQLATLAIYFPDSQMNTSEIYFWRSLSNKLFPGEEEAHKLELEVELKSCLSKKRREETDKRVSEMWNKLTNKGKDLYTDFASLKKLEEKDGLQPSLQISDEDWVDIPAGEFTMGEGKFKRTFTRQHLVAINTFQMLKTPVTFAMYDAYCISENKDKPDDEGWGRGWQPVINVSYWDAVDYVNWLNIQTGWSCRLPTEAEWEYACRAGTTKAFWTGASINNDRANYYDHRKHRPELYWGGWERKKTMPVDFYAPNPWGLHDMTGNVYEMCASLYDEEYTGMECQDATGERDIKPKIAARRVTRGGYWRSERDELRSASRSFTDPDGGSRICGFRLARDLP